LSKAGLSVTPGSPSMPGYGRIGREPDMGRPAHKPDPTSRRQVEAMAAYGVREADIATVIAIDPKTLRKHYRQELNTGAIKANSKVAESLYRKALGDGSQSVTAAIFWLKTRAQWKETTVTEHGSKDGGPIVIHISPDDAAL
jgi:hypothetical protein